MGWSAVSFTEIEGWENDDHEAAFACFRMSAKAFCEKSHVSRKAVKPGKYLLGLAKKALRLDMKSPGRGKAREFFEQGFHPYRYQPTKGFVTAYFEPEVEASRTHSTVFPYPLYARPEDLIAIEDQKTSPDGLPDHLEFGRKTGTGIVEYFDRGEIDNGAIRGKRLELFWLRSIIDGFYIHVQGSARLLLENGETARISYAGKTGHAYTSIGKLLVDRGVFTVENANMTNIRAWLEEDLKRAEKILHENRSFIFFQELKNHDPDFGPIAAAGVQLTPGRSLAVDKDIHAYGTPVWVSTTNPLPQDTKPFQRLVIAQDTGSAIVGPVRGDLFIGSGDEAGIIAGAVRHEADFVVFKPVAEQP